jgi:hypothetical protein
MNVVCQSRWEITSGASVETFIWPNRKFRPYFNTASLMIKERLLNGREFAGDAVVAVELEIVKRRSDAKPARHVGSFNAANASDGYSDDVSVAQGTANQNNFQFNAGIQFQAFRAKKKNAGRANVARDQRDRIFLGDILHAAKAHGELQRSARIFALFMKNADGVCGYSSKPPDGDRGFGSQWDNFQRECANSDGANSWQRLRNTAGFSACRQRKFSLCFRQRDFVDCVHLDPRDAAARFREAAARIHPIWPKFPRKRMECQNATRGRWRQSVENGRSVLSSNR